MSSYCSYYSYYSARILKLRSRRPSVESVPRKDRSNVTLLVDGDLDFDWFLKEKVPKKSY